MQKKNLFDIQGDDEAMEIVAKVLDPAEERIKKQKKTRSRFVVAIAVLLVVVIVLQVLSNGVKEGTAVTVKEEIIEATAKEGDISQTLKSSGILEPANNDEVSIPGDITVEKFYVSNGDSVNEGDVIASVEKNSVLAAITDVQNLLEEVDTEISVQKDASISSSLKAAVDGTVVCVYAKSEESVVDVMYEHGALMLVSLDDLLAIRVENPGNVTVGDEVTVTDSDKNTEVGEVAAVDKETIEITVSLDDFDYDENVTVTDTAGNKLGEGTLYIYSQQKITGYSGVVSSVNVSEGDAITEGTELLALEETDYTAAYQVLMNQRILLEEQYNQLVEIASTGYVYAKEAGTISGIETEVLQTTHQGSEDEVLLSTVEESEETESEDEEIESEEAGEETAAATTAKTVNVVWLYADGSVMTEGYPENMQVELHADGEVLDTVGLSAENGWTYTWTELNAGNTDGKEIAYEICSKDKIEGYSTVAQVSGSVTVLMNIKDAEESGSKTVSQSVNIIWLDENGNEMTKGYPENVQVTLLANGEIVENIELTEENEWAYVWEELSVWNESGEEIGYQISGNEMLDGYTMTMKTSGTSTVIVYKKGTEKEVAEESVKEDIKAENMKEEIQVEEKAEDTFMPEQTQSDKENSQKEIMTNQVMPSVQSGFSVAGNSNSSVVQEVQEEETESTYVYGETVICALTPDEDVKIDVTIDELDIIKVKTGQKCEITLDAFPGQNFEGTVTEINPSGNNSGGNTKYTVTVSMKKENDMLLGMNASVQMVMDEVTGEICIPVEALVEQDGKVYVYTEFDEKKDELTGLVEVTTGLSDGESVQITDGLTGEQKYYYRYAETITYTFVK